MRCIFMSENKGNPYGISQNFLTDRRIIERLLSRTDISDSDTVLEIGAGKGHITKALSKRSKTVVSYEIDGKLYEKLRPNVAENVRLIRGDFLKCALPKSPYKVFANIPFSKTSEIMRRLTAGAYMAYHGKGSGKALLRAAAREYKLAAA